MLEVLGGGETNPELTPKQKQISKTSILLISAMLNKNKEILGTKIMLNQRPLAIVIKISCYTKQFS